MAFRFWGGVVAAVLLLASPSTAGAQTVNAEIFFCSVDNTGGGPALDGFVTTQIRQNFTGQWTGAQLLLELTTGEIFRAEFGDRNGAAPSPLFFDAFPELEFDTYVGNIAGTGGNPGAGAVDLGSEPRARFPSSTVSAPTTLSQAWSPAGGVNIVDQTDHTLAQLTLSNDVNGSWSLLTSVDGQITSRNGQLINGFFNLGGHTDCDIPEPSALALFGLMVMGVAKRGRSKRA